jgi:predicted transcriptional regulator
MHSWLARLSEPGTTARLGPLERRVLDVLWNRGRPGATRDLYPEFMDIAPTTLTTTLDRLANKGLLDRKKDGRAYVYTPRLTRDEFEAVRAARAVTSALNVTPNTKDCHPLLQFFVDAIKDRDPQLLDKLDGLIQAHRGKNTDEHG